MSNPQTVFNNTTTAASHVATSPVVKIDQTTTDSDETCAENNSNLPIPKSEKTNKINLKSANDESKTEESETGTPEIRLEFEKFERVKTEAEYEELKTRILIGRREPGHERFAHALRGFRAPINRNAYIRVDLFETEEEPEPDDPDDDDKNVYKLGPHKPFGNTIIEMIVLMAPSFLGDFLFEVELKDEKSEHPKPQITPITVNEFKTLLESALRLGWFPWDLPPKIANCVRCLPFSDITTESNVRFQCSKRIIGKRAVNIINRLLTIMPEVLLEGENCSITSCENSIRFRLLQHAKCFKIIQFVSQLKHIDVWKPKPLASLIHQLMPIKMNTISSMLANLLPIYENAYKISQLPLPKRTEILGELSKEMCRYVHLFLKE